MLVEGVEGSWTDVDGIVRPGGWTDVLGAVGVCIDMEGVVKLGG